MSDEESILNVEELLLLAVGSALGVLGVAALVLVIARLRRPAPRLEAKKSPQIVTLATPSSNNEDDRNPDVIPQKGN